MKNTARFLVASALAALAVLVSASRVHAQGGITVQAPKDGRVAVEAGEVATLAFTVRNDRRDTTLVEPKITIPQGWRTVMSPSATLIAPTDREVWLVSVKAPASAAAGSYVVTLAAGAAAMAPAGVDSVTVTIAERRGVRLISLAPPAYVMAGDTYAGAFIVRNEGNVAARFSVAARSNHGKEPVLRANEVQLGAGQMDTIFATVVMPSTTGTVQELLEITVTDLAADTVRAETTLQTTVVPTATDGPSLWTVPGEVALRTSTPGSGVSALTAWGSGRITETSNVHLDFSVRTPTGRASVFGEQEEYRLGLRTDRGSVRVGDGSYGFSRLLTGGGRSTGVELRGLARGYTGGVFVERNRMIKDAPTSTSAMIGTDATRALSTTLVAMNRSGNAGTAQLLSNATRASLGKTFVELEMAASDSQKTKGNAASVRISGDSRFVAYDITAQTASSYFAAPQAGMTNTRLSLSSHQIGSMILSGSTGMNILNPIARVDAVGQRLGSTTIGASFDNGTSIEFDNFARNDQTTINAVRGSQQTARFRSRYAIGGFDFSFGAQGAVIRQRDTATRNSLGMSATSSYRISGEHFVSLFADLGDGNGLGEGGMRTMTAGLNTEAKVGETRLRLISSLSTVAGATGTWTSYTDVAVEHGIRRATVALRARINAGSATQTNHALFLEVKNPLRLPTSPIQAVGRARATVVDAENGRGVAGALIRVGGQAAVTDANGVATFRNLKAGEYRPMVDGGAVAGRIVANDAKLLVNSTSRTPTGFTVRLARGAKVLVRLRQFEKTSATISNGGDTLTEVGALGQVIVALVSEGDTVWQTSDDRGRVDFGSVAPGRYTIALPRFEAPEFTALAQKEFQIEVAGGESRQVDFKLIPQARVVEFVGEMSIIAAPAAVPAKPATGTTTITGKPEQSPITAKPDQSPITAKPDQTPITTRPQAPRSNNNQRQNQNPSSPERQI